MGHLIFDFELQNEIISINHWDNNESENNVQEMEIHTEPAS